MKVLPAIVAHDRALELLSSCEVCLSPHVSNIDGSRFFSSPTKLFEWMGLGQAIVASDLEQLGEGHRRRRDGPAVSPGDARAVAETVARLLAERGCGRL